MFTERAIKICSQETLSEELDKIREIFRNNGYPNFMVNKIMRRHLDKADPLIGPKKRHIYLRLPFIGRTSYRFENMVKKSVNSCFPSVSTNVIFMTKSNFPNMRKDRLPTLSCSNVVYQFKCYCDRSYVGKTTQTLRKRISQHVPACMNHYIQAVKDEAIDTVGKKRLSAVKNAVKRSGICEHLFNNNECMKNYNIDRFKPISNARNNFHLGKLESVFISCFNPELCRQSDFCYSLLLF